MKVLYYYYYLFYQKILDPDPRLAATLGVTSLLGFFLNGVIGVSFAYFFCIDFNKYCMLAVLAGVLLANTFYFYTSKNVLKILKAKPKFFNSNRLTLLFIWVFSIIVISTFFWTGSFINGILDRCRVIF
jgi:hypothetical protein